MTVREEDVSEVEHFRTLYWEKMASKYNLPVPCFTGEPTEDWERDAFSQRWYLTSQAVHRIRTMVDQERRPARERWVVFASVISALTALAAILHRCA